MSKDEFTQAIERTLRVSSQPHADDGGGSHLHDATRKHSDCQSVVGGTEETDDRRSSPARMANDGKLQYPVYAVNDAQTKWDFDNVYGTGQSSLDGILRATGILIAGKYFVIAGYGTAARVALRAKGLGAMHDRDRGRPYRRPPGYAGRTPRDEHGGGAPIGEIFITATGMKARDRRKHFEKMKRRGGSVQYRPLRTARLNLEDLKSAGFERDGDPTAQRGVQAQETARFTF